MKPVAIALFTIIAGFATTAARADHSRVNIDFGIHVGSAPVYVERAPVVVSPVGHRHYTPARGYWDTVTVKTWIPGRWIASRDRWGRAHRYFEKGHYVFTTERVWIETDHRRSGRSYGYNDGHRRWNR